MNLLEPELLLEATAIWPATGPPRLFVSKATLTRDEVTRVVTDLIALAVEFGATYGVHVSGTIQPPGSS